MERNNPYAPPQAPVRDSIDKPTSKPSQIVTATNLLWSTIPLGIANGVLQWRFLAALGSVEIIVLTQILAFCVTAWLTLKISSGQNWARITYVIVSLLGLPAIIFQLPSVFSRTPVGGGITLLLVVIQVYVIWLLFSEPGRQWFSRGKVPAGA
jgi:hypothetical protein